MHSGHAGRLPLQGGRCGRREQGWWSSGKGRRRRRVVSNLTGTLVGHGKPEAALTAGLLPVLVISGRLPAQERALPT